MAEFAPTVPRFEGTVFAVWCEDGPTAQTLRDDHLEGHLHHVEKNCDRYIVAGPMRAPGTDENAGSFFLVIADSEAEARTLCEGDPYFTCGMYKTVTIMQFTPAVGQFLGGVIWPSIEAVRPFAAKARPAEG